jgi:glutamate dehydrogenase (NAD(P)+)
LKKAALAAFSIPLKLPGGLFLFLGLLLAARFLGGFLFAASTAADEILADKKSLRHSRHSRPTLAASPLLTLSGVQDRQGYFWKESAVNEQLEFILAEAFEDVVHFSDTHNVNNRIAAYMLAISRVAHTIKLRGIYA